MEKNTNENIFQMLVLSDLHFEKERKDDFEPIFNSFLEGLSSFLEKNKEWSPQCLTLVGDIAHSVKEKTEYNDVQSFIERIKSEIRTLSHVVIVPGNHDKQLSIATLPEGTSKTISDEERDKLLKKTQKDLSKKDFEIAEYFLESYMVKNRASCDITSDYLMNYFGHYADFASKFHKENWHPVPDLEIDNKLKSISGYYLIESPKICLVALNTEWKYVRNNASKHKPILTVGNEIVKQMENHIKYLRRKGYTIITLMHRSPYRLCWEDIYGGGLNENSPVERIIGMSDLIVCGHEHSVKSREPDTLMSHTLLYQNGIMFDRSPKDGRSPYSASLLRIDMKARLLSAIHIRFNMYNALGYEWIISIDTMKTYNMDALTVPKLKPYTLTNELYKEVVSTSLMNAQLEQKLILPLFYPDSSKNGIPTHIKCFIMELNSSTKEQIDRKINEIDEQKESDSEPFAHTHVIIYIQQEGGNANEEETSRNISLYKDIKATIRSKEIGHKLVTNLVLCNIFI